MLAAVDVQQHPWAEVAADAAAGAPRACARARLTRLLAALGQIIC